MIIMGFNLEKTKSIVNESNVNDIIGVFGEPSTRVLLIMMFGFILREKLQTLIFWKKRFDC